MKNFKEFVNEEVIQQTSTADSGTNQATTDSGTTHSTDSGTTEGATTEISDDILKELESILPNLDKLKESIEKIVAKMNEKNGGGQDQSGGQSQPSTS